ncbi:1-(5-phosphoribosyl)-5-[(5-phosphoribosylamino)methylideneamino]imidazole-4-carboxamide isomerase [Sporanaerobium hydrogeniformans]|uniref:1-(5-phosphoribosyl)-5-[(5-phosphoribosylamino)methylideneamino]imidazole-4-carboxamide isomerase n=1 Tax=Sporanaerobium hydrogeniformans TaxID=3072179 RepID=A0AC61DDT6_9FIRM|nr:1-(5-phosphoribosyl)-5-[(5-phosphoribosylamino)methylideneamino]imidazole-4-carboxamide isomerase [Sporanaerobium hydrogeniformans]PHV71020.1 1-(5-phosphoribosyl)-5-[(5-phosphoribosylamino)methylideneamino]imidazole-4-carboxamide isomerase [Sporanaerobium hydrogeniformans]
MKLYPAIDLKAGSCVRLFQGDYNQVTVFGNSPVEMAKKWESLGGAYLHIVDLDGAKEGKGMNDTAITEMVKALHIPIELGGGIRTLEDIKAKLDLGVDRVILGSAAVKNKALVKEALEIFGPEKIVIGVDAKGGKVAIEGWLEVTDTTALEFCKELESMGVKTVIYTDIAKDGMMQGPNIEETAKLVEATKLDIIASGGVSSLEDLERLEVIGVHGAIIGKALYIGAIDLEEAVKRFQ